MKKLSLAVLQALSAGVVVSLAATSVEAQTAQKLEKIEITGSNIKRIEGETALPVTVITKEDIEKTGVTTTAQLLDKIGVASSYNLSNGLGDSGQPGFSGASLRGLGSSNTLVLLNGRRVANYATNGAAVDVNSIPLGAVERVEILKDGASAVYGTDAIGGVINFILKSDYQGAEASYYKMQTRRGGGETDKFSVTAGYGDLSTQRFNVLVSYDKEKGDPIAARQRAFASTGIREDLGIVNVSSRTYPANFRWSGGPGLVNQTAANNCAPALGAYYLGGNSCVYDYTAGLDIYPEVNRETLVARAVFKLTANAQLFAEYTNVKNEARFASSETPIDGAFTPSGAPIIYPAGGRYYPGPFTLAAGTTATPSGDIALRWRGRDSGLRTNIPHSESSRPVFGIKGTLSDWDYEAAISRAENKIRESYVDGWLSETRLRAAMLTGNINPFTLTGQDAAGQALLNGAKILQDVRISKFTTDIVDAKASRELMQLPAGPLSMAVGFENRKEKMDDQPLQVLFSGDVLGGGGNLPPVTGERKVQAVFAEFSIPVLKTLEGTLAMRSDHYSDFGNSFNPKVGLRWTPTKSLLVRASYNTGFRAPSLPDLYLPNFTGNTAGSHNDPIRCPGGTPIGSFVDTGSECNIQFNTQFGGNPKLTPEKSDQATIGMVFEPQSGTSLGADLFWIKRRNSLGSLGDSTVFETYGAIDPLTALGHFVRFGRSASGRCTNDPAGETTPANVPCAINFDIQLTDNLGIYTISGIDLNGAASFTNSLGKFRISLDGTYISRYQYQREKGGAYNNNLGGFTSDNGAITRWRHVLAVNYRNGPWSATLSQNFVAGYNDDPSADIRRAVGNNETYDFQGSWSGIKYLTVTLGVRNIFDRDPPQSNQNQTFQVGYDPRYGDPFGRTFYGKITYSFK